MICPACGYDNIEGMDQCENCTEPLRDLDVPRSDATEGLVRSVMEDSLELLEEQQFLTARATDAAIEVVRRMKHTGADCALVLDEDLVGIFTARDSLQLLDQQDDQIDAVTISDVMTSNPEVLEETDSVAAALNRMSVGGYIHVPVRHRRTGSYRIVSIEQMLNYLAEKDW